MQAECGFKCNSTEERQGRTIVIVGAVITLVTLLVLLFGWFSQG
jgi:uncharacterized membrane protein